MSSVEIKAQFRVGDKVVHEMWGEGHIAFGPFLVRETTTPCYLVEDLEGRHFTGLEAYMTSAPKFKVGQKVTFTYSADDEVYEVVSGPYPTSDRSVRFWVIKDGDGTHDTSYEKHMVPVGE